MAYRAPELFDVKTGQTIDEKVDIWVRFSEFPLSCTVISALTQSLGCTLYALAYSHSPFENIQTIEQGGSIAMAVLNAQYKHPQSAYSQGLKNLIDSMLKVNPTDRPDINQVCWRPPLVRWYSANAAIDAGHCNDRQGHPKPVVNNDPLLQILHCCVYIFTFIGGSRFSIMLLSLLYLRTLFQPSIHSGFIQIQGLCHLCGSLAMSSSSKTGLTFNILKEIITFGPGLSSGPLPRS